MWRSTITYCFIMPAIVLWPVLDLGFSLCGFCHIDKEEPFVVAKSLISAEMPRMLVGVQHDTFAYYTYNVSSKEKGPKNICVTSCLNHMKFKQPTLRSDKRQHANCGHPLLHFKKKGRLCPSIQLTAESF